METMNKSYKAIKKQYADPAQKASTLELIAKLKSAAEASADFKPEMAAEMDPEKRTKFLTDYHAAIQELVKQVESLEKAVQEGRTKDCEKWLTEINESKISGHSEFMEKN